MKLSYHWEGDYLISDLGPPESPQVGIWGERRRQFLRKHRKPLYDGMLMDGTLSTHLEEIDQTAEAMLEKITSQMANREGVTEELKAKDQLRWVQDMNSIRNRAEEIIVHTVIHA